MEMEEKVQENAKKSTRKKILLFSILAIVLIGIVIWAIQVIPVANRYKREHIDAKAFVSNWNARSKDGDLLTGGLKISDGRGEHEYLLENGATLRYSVNTYWWVKYMSTAVILEFPEENQGNVYGLSKMFLEAFNEVTDVESVFDRACVKVDADRPTVMERFSVGLDGESRETYATFVEAQIFKSDAYVGYSWNLTIEEWCENFNKNLELALEDAAQAAYSWVTEIEPVETSFKDEWLAMYREKYKPLNASDFIEIAYYTDGIHENKVYQTGVPRLDENLNLITLVVDENGYIFDCQCLIRQGLQDVVNQHSGGDRRNFFMEFYGYPALTCTGTGESYAEALKAVEGAFAGVEITEVSETVTVGAAINQMGFASICLPNREGVLDGFNTSVQSGEWEMIEIDFQTD